MSAVAQPNPEKNLPWIEPIRPILRKDPVDDPDWTFELKYDGFRDLAYIENSDPRIMSCNRHRMARFDDLAGRIAQALNRRDAILDGEIVCVDEDGRPIFNDVFHGRRTPVFMAFDLVWLDGQDLHALTLTQRKAKLKRLIGRKRTDIGYAAHVSTKGRELYEQVQRHYLEGIVAKRQDAPYDHERTTWYKIKNPTYSQKEDRQDLFDPSRAKA